MERNFTKEATTPRFMFNAEITVLSIRVHFCNFRNVYIMRSKEVLLTNWLKRGASLLGTLFKVEEKEKRISFRKREFLKAVIISCYEYLLQPVQCIYTAVVSEARWSNQWVAARIEESEG